MACNAAAESACSFLPAATSGSFAWQHGLQLLSYKAGSSPLLEQGHNNAPLGSDQKKPDQAAAIDCLAARGHPGVPFAASAAAAWQSHCPCVLLPT